MPLRRILLSAINLAPLIFLALMVSCARPLGPSYTIEKQTLAIRFIAQPQPFLDVQADFRVLASGIHPLPAIDIQLPDEKIFSPQDLQITLDGHDVSSMPVKDIPNRVVRIQFDPAFQPGRRQNLSVHYTLPPPLGIDQGAASAAFVAGGDWYPALLSPKGMFAKLFLEFNKWDLEIRVPQDFLVHASGRPRHSRKDGRDIIYVLQQHTGDVPFVVAGRYRQQLLRPSLPHASKDQIFFWTFQPIPSDMAQQAGARIAEVMAAYDHRFGLRSVRPNSLWVVECLSTSVPSANADDPTTLGRFCDTSPPDTVLLPAAAWANGVASGSFQENATRAMAYLWLGHRSSSPTRDDRSLSGIYAYAAHDVLLARLTQFPRTVNDSNARPKLIARYLTAYDQKPPLRRDAVDKSPSTLSPKENSAPEPAFEKSVLFFFALEDQYGPQPLHRAIARVVHARGEQGYNQNDLRAALEGETQKNAASFFHRWLDRLGIPEDFRAHYENNYENTSDAAAKPVKGDETMRDVIVTDRAPKPIGPYAQALKVGQTSGLIFVSGQVAIDPRSGQFAGGDIRQQTERTLENLKAVIEAAGSNLLQVAKTTVFVKDMNDFSAMNEVYGRYFAASPPARSTVEVARLPKDALVEIDAIAVI